MVSSSNVKADCNEITSLFSEYNKVVHELSSSWKGISFDNFVSKAGDFSSEYLSALSKQMSSFAVACDAYMYYVIAKENLEIAHSNFNRANLNNDQQNIAKYRVAVSDYSSRVSKLKSRIISNLAIAKSIKLDGGSGNVAVSGTEYNKNSSSSSVVVKKAIDWALTTASDDSRGYSQNTRNGNPNYDCSSFVINAYQNAGIPVKEHGASYTGNMRSAFESAGFEWIPGPVDVNQLQPGDVILSEANHTEMYIGDGKNVGAHADYDGIDGDSSGQEINVAPYWDFGQDGVLRYKENDK